MSKFCQSTMAVTSQARVVDAHSPSGEKPCAMRSSTECTAPGAEEYSHNGPSNALPEAVSMPAHNPSPRVQTGAIPTSVIAHVRGPTFDHPSMHGSAALATPGAATNIAAPRSRRLRLKRVDVKFSCPEHRAVGRLHYGRPRSTCLSKYFRCAPPESIPFLSPFNETECTIWTTVHSGGPERTGSLSCRAYAGGHSWKSGSRNMGSSEADLALIKKIQPVVTGVGTLIGVSCNSRPHRRSGCARLTPGVRATPLLSSIAVRRTPPGPDGNTMAVPTAGRRPSGHGLG